MKNMLTDNNGLLFPCFGFRFSQAATSYFSSGDRSETHTSFQTSKITYVPRSVGTDLTIDWVMSLQDNQPEKVYPFLLKPGDKPLPQDGGEDFAYHVCLMRGGKGLVKPENWQYNHDPESKGYVPCVTGWSWTDQEKIFGDISGNSNPGSVLHAARLGMGLIYSMPQRIYSRSIGTTFDLVTVLFRTVDDVEAGEPHILEVRVPQRIANVKMSEMEGESQPKLALLEKLRVNYRNYFGDPR